MNANPELLACAVPKNGHLLHLIIDRPERRNPNFAHITDARALCGVSGRDAWGGGFMIIRDGTADDAECESCKRAAKRPTEGDKA